MNLTPNMKISDNKTIKILGSIFIFLFILLIFLALYLYLNQFNVGIDTFLAHYFYIHRNKNLVFFFLLFTKGGSYLASLILGLVLSFFLLWSNLRSYILPFLVSQIGASVMVTIIKHVVARPRPGLDIAFYIEKSKSFPSGHSSNSLVLYGFLAYIVIRNVKNKLLKKVITALLITTIILIGLSRVYLDVHYLGDVLGGYLVGSLWLIIGIIMTEISLKKILLNSK